MSTSADEYDPSEFPRFAVTVDLALLTVRPPHMEILLVRRNDAPQKGAWALPGGFVGPNQDLLTAAQVKLADKTGVDVDRAHLEQLATFGEPKRDPRMRIVSVAHLAMVPEPGELAVDHAAWHRTDDLDALKLAFDHEQIAAVGIERARAKLEYTTLGTSFCGETFTIVELRSVYEAVWATTLDPANFHRKALASEGFVEPTGESVSHGRGRPAQVYRAGTATELHPPISRS